MAKLANTARKNLVKFSTGDADNVWVNFSESVINRLLA